MRKILTIILAGGIGSRLNVLSYKRAKPAVPFGGKYRIIDFVLSNCVNSGLYDVQIMTQYRPFSLKNHIGGGQPWDMDRLYGGVEILHPYLDYNDASRWYRGTADAIYQNLQYVEEEDCDHVMVLSGDHIYKMDYSKMIDFHEDHNADLTIGVIPVPWEDTSRFGIMKLNENKRVINFQEKPKSNPISNLASMGIYIFTKDVLINELIADGKNPETSHDFGKNIIPRMIDAKNVFAYEFTDYWKDVGTIEAYWEANMDLIKEDNELDIFDKKWLIHTRSEERPPVKFPHGIGAASESLISNGCIVLGKVERSVLSPGVFVDEGAVVKDSIIFSNSKIGKNSKINRAILDKNITIGENVEIGFMEEDTVNKDYPEHLNTGITVVGKNACIPSDIKIGKNCLIATDVTEQDYDNQTIINSGETISSPGFKL
jgi:glucose-1-phosphate adenylyltransferase